MRSLRVIAVCLALIILPVLIESCCGVGNGACPCNPDWETNFSIQSMSLDTKTKAELGGVWPAGLGKSASALSSLVLKIDMDVEYRRALLEQPSFTPTMAAFACSPPEPVSDQKITALSITSNNVLTTMDTTIVAGADLARLYFKFPPPFVYLNEALYETSITLTTGRDVDVAQTHRFTVAIKLDDGRSFEMTTKDLEFTPD